MPSLFTMKKAACVLLFLAQQLSHIRLFATPWAAARQAFLSFTISWSLFKLMSIESVMPSNPLMFLSGPTVMLPALGLRRNSLGMVPRSSPAV